MIFLSRWLRQLLVTGGSDRARDPRGSPEDWRYAARAVSAAAPAARPSRRRAQAPDRVQLLLRGGHGLVGVGGVAVDLAGDGVAHLLVHLRGHDAHSGHGRAEGCEEIGDGVGPLEIEQGAAAALGLLGRKAEIEQHGVHLTADAAVHGGKLKMKALLRIGHAAPGEEGPAHESLRRTLLLEHAEVDVVGERPIEFGAEGLKDRAQLVPVGDGEALFAAGLGSAASTPGEGAVEQLRQAPGKVGAGR